VDRESVVDLKNLKAFLAPGARRGGESARLDGFLATPADPVLMSSLRRDEGLRRRWRLAAAALVLGLALGGGGAWWLFGRPVSLSSREPARLLAVQGMAFAKAKEIPQAWADLRVATEMAPHLADAWAAMGLALFYGGQIEDAERAFRRCAEIDPEDPRGFQGLGDVAFATGDYDKAEEYWLRGDARRSLARLRLLQGRFAEAAPLVRELARKTPDPVYTPLMVAALRAGRLSPELRWRLGPGLAGSRSPETARGWRLYFAHQYGEAIGVFSRVLAGQPRDGSARIGRGWCRLKARAVPEARADFEGALAAWPSNYSALNGLGWCLRAQGEAARAAEAWERVLALHPESPEAPESLKGLGLLAFERGDFAGADRYLTRSVLQNPYDLETRTLLEEVLKRGGATPGEMGR
jgi:Flp pilus assembly protein TadD